MGFAYTPPFLSPFLSPLNLSTLDIGNDFTPRLLVIFLAMVYLGLTPSKLATEDYGSTLLLLELYLLILALEIGRAHV